MFNRTSDGGIGWVNDRPSEVAGWAVGHEVEILARDGTAARVAADSSASTRSQERPRRAFSEKLGKLRRTGRESRERPRDATERAEARGGASRRTA